MPESPNLPSPQYGAPLDKGGFNVEPFEPFKPYESYGKSPNGLGGAAPSASDVLDGLAGNLDNLTKASNPFVNSISQHTPIKTPLENTKRYDDPVYGFDPFNPNLENQYGDRQSAIAQWTNNILKFGATAGGSFLQAIATIPTAIYAAQQGKLSAMYDNPLSNTIGEWMDGLENTLPNYQSSYEAAHPVMSYLNPASLGNSWGGVLKNLGFTVGAIAGSLVEDVAIGAMTAGLGELPLIAPQLTMIFGKLGKVFAAEKGALRVVENLGHAGDVATQLARFGKGANPLRLAETVENANNVRKAIDAAYGSVKLTNRLRYGLALTTSAISEGIFEANQTYRTIEKDLYDDFRQAYGRDPNDEESEEIARYARSGGNADLMANVALLMATNHLTFGSVLQPTKAAQKLVTSEVTQGASIGLKKGSLDVFEQVVKPKGRFELIKNIVSKPTRMLQANAVEGFEEGMQFSFQRSAETYYKRKFDDKAISETDNFMQSLGQGLKEMVTTREGLENVMMGIMSGSVIHGGKRLLEKYKGIDNNRDKLVNSTLSLLNGERVTGLFEDKYNEAVVAKSLDNDMKKALESGDIFEYKNLKFQQLYNFISSGVRANKHDLRISQLQMLKELSGAEFEKTFGFSFNETNKKTVDAFVDSVIKKAEDIKQNIEKVDTLFKNPFDRRTQRMDHVGFEEYKNQLALDLSEMNENHRRIDGLTQAIQQVLPTVDMHKLTDLTHIVGVTHAKEELEKRLDQVNESLSLLSAEKDSDAFKTAKKEKEWIERMLPAFTEAIAEGYHPDIYSELGEVLNYYAEGERVPSKMHVSPIDLLPLLEKGQDLFRIMNANNRTLYHYQQLTSKKGYTQYIQDVLKAHNDRYGKALANNPLNPEGHNAQDTPPDEEKVDKHGNPIKPASIEAPEGTKKTGNGKVNSAVGEDVDFEEVTAKKKEETDKAKTEADKAKKEWEAKKAEMEKKQDELVNRAGENKRAREEQLKQEGKSAEEAERIANEERENSREKEEFTRIEAELQEKERQVREAEARAEMLAKELSTLHADRPVDISEIEDDVEAMTSGTHENSPVASKGYFAKVSPTALMNRIFSKNHQDAKHRDNLWKAVFGNSFQQLYNKITLAIKASTKGKSADEYSLIYHRKEATNFYRSGYATDIEVVVDGETLGYIHPSDSLYFKRGKEMIPALEMTAEEYAKVTGNDASTYNAFMDELRAYDKAIEPIIEAYKAGKTAFTNEDVRKLLDFYVSYGNFKETSNKESATDVKDLKYRGKGDAIISLPMQFSNGKWERTSRPTILNEGEISDEDKAKLWEFIGSHINQLQGINSRYIYIFQLPDGSYRSISPVAARPKDANKEVVKGLFERIKAYRATKDAKAYKDLNHDLRNQIYISDANNRKGNGSNISVRVNEHGQLFLNIYNDYHGFQPRSFLLDDSAFESPEAMIAAANKVIAEKSKTNKELARLNLKLDPQDIKTFIENDTAGTTINALGDALTVATTPTVFENYNLFVKPLGEASANPAEEQTRGKRPQIQPLTRQESAILKTVKENIDDINGVYKVPINQALNGTVDEQRAVLNILRDQFLIDTNGARSSFGNAISKAVLPLVGGRFVEDKRSMKAALQEVFGLSVEHASAVSEMYDRVAKTWAKRNGKEKADFYHNLTVMQGKTELIPEEVLYQNDTRDYIRTGEMLGADPDTFMVARERFDLSKLELLSAHGSDRDVFRLGDGKVLKVAKSARGLRQNNFEGAEDLVAGGVLPKVLERGLNYVVVEEVTPLNEDDLDYIDTENAKGWVVKKSAPADQRQALQDLADFMNEYTKIKESKFVTTDDAYRQYDRIQKLLSRYGFSAAEGHDILWGDLFNNPSNWGVKNGKLIHLDGGTFSGASLIADYHGKDDMDDNAFRRVYQMSKNMKRTFGDTDSETMYQDDEQGGKRQPPRTSMQQMEANVKAYLKSKGLDYDNYDEDDNLGLNKLINPHLEPLIRFLDKSGAHMIPGKGETTFTYRELLNYLITYELNSYTDVVAWGQYLQSRNPKWEPNHLENVLRKNGFLFGEQLRPLDSSMTPFEGMYVGDEDMSEGIANDASRNLRSGNPLYLNQDARAAIRIAADGRAIIYAITDPNVSSPLHELAHFFESSLTLKEKYAVLQWAGHNDWTRETSEKFARGFEKYLAEGVAEKASLKGLFDKFKQWLLDIYKGIVGSDIDIELNDKMRSIYAEMIGDDFKERTTHEVQKEKVAEKKAEDKKPAEKKEAKPKKLVEKKEEKTEPVVNVPVPVIAAPEVQQEAPAAPVQPTTVQTETPKKTFQQKDKYTQQDIDEIVGAYQAGETTAHEAQRALTDIFTTNNELFDRDENMDAFQSIHEIASETPEQAPANQNPASESTEQPQQPATQVAAQTAQEKPAAGSAKVEQPSQKKESPRPAVQPEAPKAEPVTPRVSILKELKPVDVKTRKSKTNPNEKEVVLKQTGEVIGTLSQNDKGEWIDDRGNTFGTSATSAIYEFITKFNDQNRQQINESAAAGATEGMSREQLLKELDRVDEEIIGKNQERDAAIKAKNKEGQRRITEELNELYKKYNTLYKRIFNEASQFEPATIDELLNEALKAHQVEEQDRQALWNDVEEGDESTFKRGDFVTYKGEPGYAVVEVQQGSSGRFLYVLSKGDNFEDVHASISQLQANTDTEDARLDREAHAFSAEQGVDIAPETHTDPRYTSGEIAWYNGEQVIVEEVHDRVKKSNDTDEELQRKIYALRHRVKQLKVQVQAATRLNQDDKLKALAPKYNEAKAELANLEAEQEKYMHQDVVGQDVVIRKVSGEPFITTEREAEIDEETGKLVATGKKEEKASETLKVQALALSKDVNRRTQDEFFVEYVGLKSILDNLQARFGIKYKLVHAVGENWKGRFKGGVVYINSANFDRTTPFHEYLHPFIEVLKLDNTDLYNKLSDELATLRVAGNKLALKVAGEVDNNPAYKDATESEKNDEMLVRYISHLASRNVNEDGERISHQQFRAMKSLIEKFREWLGKIWVQLSSKQGGKSLRRMPLGVFTKEQINKEKAKENTDPTKRQLISFPETATLQDIADLVSLTDIAFDLESRMEFLKQMDVFQRDAVGDEENILKQIRKRVAVLDHAGQKRVGSDLLSDEARSMRKLLENEDTIESLNNFVEQGIKGLRWATEEFNRVTAALKDEETKLTQEDVRELNKTLAVVKNMLGFYLSDVNRLLERTIDGQELDQETELAYRKVVNQATRVSNSIHARSVDLTVEWLYPAVEAANELIKEKYPEFVLTKEEFKNQVYRANSDVDRMFFLMGSVGSSRDPLSGIVRDVIHNAVEHDVEYGAFVRAIITGAYQDFLTQHGLQNKHEDTIAYYKQNYLRRARVWEKIDTKTNEDGKLEAVYGYVERWAFHEEFLRDKWAEANRTFLDSIPTPVTDEDFAKYNKAVMEWMTKHGSLENPNPALYTNPEFARVKQDPFFNVLYDAYREANDHLAHDERLPFGMVPQVSKGKNAFSDLSFSVDGAKKAASKLGRFALPQDEAQTYVEEMQNLDGSTYRMIKVAYVRALDESDLDLALPETINKYAASSRMTATMRTLEPNIVTLKSLIDHDSDYTKRGREVIKVNSKTEVLFDTVFKRPARELEPRVNRQLSAFIDDVVYGVAENDSYFNLLGIKVDLNKWGDNMSFLTALSNMAFNLTAGLSNVTIGNVQTLGEAIGGKYYKPENWKRAQGLYFGQMSQFIGDTSQLKKSKITQLGVKYDAIQGEFRDKYGKRFVGSVMHKYATTDTIFFLNHVAEHQIQLTGMLALMDATKVTLRSGEQISLYDAHQINDKGYLKLRDDVIDWDDQKNLEFTKRLHALNKLLNGNYSKFDKAMLQRTWYGKLALIYRKFIYNGFRNRFGRKRMDYELKDVHEGYYRTFFSKLASDIDEYKWQAAGRAFKGEGWSEDERYAYRKTMFELAVLVGSTIIGGMLAGSEDDDKDERTWIREYATLLMVRLRGDIGTYSVFAPADVFKMLQNPTAIMPTLDRFKNFLVQVISDPFQTYTRKTGAFAQGDSMLSAKLQKMIPIWRQWVNLQAPEEQRKFYNLLNKNF